MLTIMQTAMHACRNSHTLTFEQIHADTHTHTRIISHTLTSQQQQRSRTRRISCSLTRQHNIRTHTYRNNHALTSRQEICMRTCRNSHIPVNVCWQLASGLTNSLDIKSHHITLYVSESLNNTLTFQKRKAMRENTLLEVCKSNICHYSVRHVC